MCGGNKTPSPQKAKRTLNYARVNTRGLAKSTVKARRVLRKVVKGTRANSLTSSPMEGAKVRNFEKLAKAISHELRDFRIVEGTVNQVLGDSVKDNSVLELIKGHACVNASSRESGALKQTENAEGGNNSSPTITNLDTHQVDIAEMGREEEKLRMRERIKQLEKEWKRREEEKQKEDKEFKELQERLAFLERKLSQSTPPRKESPVKKKDKKSSENIFSALSKLVGGGNEGDKQSGGEGKAPNLDDIKQFLNVSERKDSRRKRTKSRKKKARSASSSDSSDTDTEDSSSSSSDDKDETPRKSRKKGKKSGFYTKPGNSKLKSHELFAHVALDDNLGGDRTFESLTFNLLVAGELEIIDSQDVTEKEKKTRIKLLKLLAYKQEVLSKDEILNQYANFVRRVEKGKYRWGSKSSLRSFEQQLLYCVSIEGRKDKQKSEWGIGKRTKTDKFENRKKYCLEFNRGTCNMTGAHEGLLHGKTVLKQHICRKCLINEGVESNHPEKECEKSK